LALASAGYHVGVLLHHLHARPGQLLDERMARHMIRVRMARKKDFDICELESQLFHASPNDGKRSFKTRIDQDVAVGGRDQVGGKPLGTDIVKMIGDAVRWKGFIPITLGYERARCD